MIDESSDEFGSRVRFSRLKLMAKSPAHYAAGVDTSTSAKDKGTAVHAILFRGKRVTFYGEKTESGRAAPRNGAKWEAFQSANAGALILSAREYDQVQRMVEAVRADRQAMEALTGTAEETLLFDFLNLESRTTPDVWSPDSWAELKTSISADPFRFTHQSLRMYYHAQMAFHREGLWRAKRVKPKHGYVVAVESTAPYPVTVFRMTDNALDKGDRTIRAWFEQLKTCLASDQWPPYSQSVVDLDVPESEELIFAGGAEDGEPHTAENLPAGW